MKRTKTDCFHELGHTLVGLSLGTPVLGVFVDPPGHPGKAAVMKSFVADWSQVPGNITPASEWYRPLVCETAVAFAGSLAQARVTKQSFVSALATGGGSDFVKAMGILGFIHDDHRQAAKIYAAEIARRILRKRWQPLAQLAAKLQETGFVHGHEADSRLMPRQCSLFNEFDWVVPSQISPVRLAPPGGRSIGCA